LRDRKDDIPLLVARFLSDISAASGKVIRDLSRDAMHALLDYEWPGNVRELKNFIEYAVIRCKEESIQINDLPPEVITKPSPAFHGLQSGIDLKQQLLEALKHNDSNRSRTAHQLGIGRATLYRRMSKYKIPSKKAN